MDVFYFTLTTRYYNCWIPMGKKDLR